MLAKTQKGLAETHPANPNTMQYTQSVNKCQPVNNTGIAVVAGVLLKQARELQGVSNLLQAVGERLGVGNDQHGVIHNQPPQVVTPDVKTRPRTRRPAA
jgi:hypothetical protein